MVSDQGLPDLPGRRACGNIQLDGRRAYSLPKSRKEPHPDAHVTKLTRRGPAVNTG